MSKGTILSKFERWQVLSEAPTRFDKRGYKQRVALCKCACGAVGEVLINSLRTGHSKSCGCLQKEVAASKATHGHSRTGRRSTPELTAYNNMLQRCFNPKAGYFECYGGRGITVCERWLEGFQPFLDDMGLKPSPAHSLDRINNDGNYEPVNCKWSTKREQTLNRRPRNKKEI